MICVCIFVNMYVCMCEFVCVYMDSDSCVYVCVCMYLCVYAFVLCGGCGLLAVLAPSCEICVNNV